MKRVRAQDPSAALESARILARGGVILYPTDTLYGLGADAISDAAVAKIYAIKGRDEGKPIHALVTDMAMAGRYAEVTDIARVYADAFFPGPLTLVLKKKQGIETGIARTIDTFGFRVPDSELCRTMSRAFDGPITATSANRSGMPSESTVDAILAQLGAAAALIDLVIDAGELPSRIPSTVVDLTSGAPITLREGVIPVAAIDRLGHPQSAF